MYKIDVNIKKIIVTLILIVVFLNSGIIGITKNQISLAANDALDYDFTDELSEDRVGIGFKWQATTKTLTITAIKNSNALIKLPEDSTIDIQGNIENSLSGIYCKGALTIKGNSDASLKLNKCEYSTSFKIGTTSYISYYGIYSQGNLTVESGNINLSLSNLSGNTSGAYINNYYYGIRAQNVTINGGNINMSLLGTGTNTTVLYIPSNLCVNDGILDLKSGGPTVEIINANGNAEINGGTMTLSSEVSGKTFKSVPSINPNYKWIIQYNKEEANLETATTTDITDIYTVYDSKIMKILKDNFVFTDIEQGKWYYDSVKYVFENGIMTGLNEETFAPSNNLTRGQMVTLLYKMEGTPEVEGIPTFPDVQDSSKYYYKAVKWASDNNIVTGYANGNFGPKDFITRAQLAVILYRYAQFKGKNVSTTADLSQFPDKGDVAKWAQDAVTWAVEKGIITGNENKQTGVKTINPRQNATRAQVAAMIERYCKNI